MQLNGLSPEKLGRLFPVIVTDANPKWPNLFAKEKKLLENHLETMNVFRITHIGSTAIPNLKAKPTIDILLEIKETTETYGIIHVLGHIGYHHIPRPDNPPPHMMFVKGYTQAGFRGQAFHIHVRYPGDWDEPYFRDYLIQHPEEARKYEHLKLLLSQKFRNDREAYTDAKTKFIKRINRLARME